MASGRRFLALVLEFRPLEVDLRYIGFKLGTLGVVIKPLGVDLLGL